MVSYYCCICRHQGNCVHALGDVLTCKSDPPALAPSASGGRIVPYSLSGGELLNVVFFTCTSGQHTHTHTRCCGTGLHKAAEMVLSCVGCCAPNMQAGSQIHVRIHTLPSGVLDINTFVSIEGRTVPHLGSTSAAAGTGGHPSSGTSCTTGAGWTLAAASGD